MTAKIYIPLLAAIVMFLAIIAGVMVHRHEHRVYERNYVRQSENQAIAADCIALAKTGPTDASCRQFLAKHPGLNR